MTTKNAINQRVERLALDQIKELPYVQNPNANSVKWLVDNFDAPKLGKPIVSLRDGVYYLVDGYHRVAALRKLAVHHSMFWVVEGFTADEETRLMNERKYGNKNSNKTGGLSMSTNNSAVNTPATSANGAPAVFKAPNQRIELIPIAKLVSADYQRPTNGLQLKEIVAAFDESRLDPLLVAEGDGCYYLIDGLHRSKVLKALGYTHVYARVLSGLSYEQQAKFFRSQNDGKRPISTFDEFKAGIESKDPECLAIATIAKSNGFEVGRGQSFTKIESVNGLVYIMRAFGEKNLDRTLCLIANTWTGIQKATHRDVLLGVAEFVKRYGMCDFPERLNDKFRAIMYDYEDTVTRFRSLSAKTRMQRLCQILVKHYNIGLGSNSKKRLKFEEDAQ